MVVVDFDDIIEVATFKLRLKGYGGSACHFAEPRVDDLRVFFPKAAANLRFYVAVGEYVDYQVLECFRVLGFGEIRPTLRNELPWVEMRVFVVVARAVAGLRAAD